MGARAQESPHGLAQAEGGEGMLLDELRASGVCCDPLTQLVVTCEVCRRPSNKECWTCGMRICDFCTLKRHWKVGAPERSPLLQTLACRRDAVLALKSCLFSCILPQAP